MVSPKRFLPPESEPWGRSVDQDITQIKIDNAKALGESTNAFKSINSSMRLISKQITDLTTLTTTLSAQQVTLAAQQIQLTQSVADITALNSSRVSSVGDQMSLASAVVPASWTTATTVSFTKPAWAVNAFVTVLGSATAFSGAAAGGLSAYVGISGVSGPTVFGETTIPNEGVVSVLAFNRTFTAGATVIASVQWRNAYGLSTAASGTVQATVSVLWSK